MRRLITYLLQLVRRVKRNENRSVLASIIRSCRKERDRQEKREDHDFWQFRAEIYRTNGRIYTKYLKP